VIPLIVPVKELDMNRIIKDTLPETARAKQDEMQSRREVLRTALMVGCGLLVPITLFSASATAAENRVPKASVKYQNQPKGKQKCGTCMNFIAATKTCKRVEGPINPDGWCILWAKKA
jgi:hypothetical protein